MKPEIKELYKIKEENLEQVYEMMTKAFKNYVKLVGTFPDWEDRQAAIEMVIRFYGAFDFRYGNAYSLDEKMAEKGLALMERSGARRLLLIHHDPRSTDEGLLAREARLAGKARYAREGEEIVL